MNLANWITSTRFLLVPFIYWNLTNGTKSGIGWALLLLFVAGMTDVLDGWAARARNEVSELGKTLDPLADKMVIFGSLLALAIRWQLPAWLVGIYLVKEVVQVTAGYFLLRKYRKLIPANGWGKASTFSFFLGFGMFFIYRPIGFGLLAIAIALSVYAFYTYYLAFKKFE